MVIKVISKDGLPKRLDGTVAVEVEMARFVSRLTAESKGDSEWKGSDEAVITEN